MARTYGSNILDETGQIRIEGFTQFTDADPTTPAPLNATSPVGTITSGALPTVTLASTTGAQVSTARDVNLYVPLTGDATNNAATCAIALSADNSTYTTVGTVSLAAAVNNTGAVVLVETVRVPAGWYVKLTTSHMTIGSAGACSYA
jgi:hypothetical protein